MFTYQLYDEVQQSRWGTCKGHACSVLCFDKDLCRECYVSEMKNTLFINATLSPRSKECKEESCSNPCFDKNICNKCYLVELNAKTTPVLRISASPTAKYMHMVYNILNHLTLTRPNQPTKTCQTKSCDVACSQKFCHNCFNAKKANERRSKAKKMRQKQAKKYQEEAVEM